MSAKKYYLLEDFDPSLDYRDGTVIPLNPYPLYQLGEKNIEYRIMEDYYDEKELRKNEASYFDQQLDWFDAFDRYIQDQVLFCKENSISLARHHHNRIKYFVDAVIIQNLILQAFLKKIGPDASIVYVKKEGKKQKNRLRDFKADKNSLKYAEILPELCSEQNIPFELRELKGSPSKRTKGTSSLFLVIKPLLKRLYHLVKYKKISRKFAGAATDALRVVFIHSGTPHLDPLIQDSIERGFRVYLRSKDAIHDLSSLRESQCALITKSCGDSLEKEIQEQCQAAARNFAQNGAKLLEWIDGQSHHSISKFVLPYLEEFLENDCFEVLKQARNFREFYKFEKIDYVVSHTSSDEVTKSALIAADLSEKVQSVGVQHCCDVFENRIMPVSDIDPFDLYFSTDEFSKKRYTRYASQSHIRSSEVFQSPHYLRDIQAQYLKQPKSETKVKKTILYVPTKLASQHRRHFNCMVYPITWFLDYQKKLFEYFASKEEFEFIYKEPLNESGYVQQTVVPYLKEKGYSNIRIEKQSMGQCLAQSDGVIVDRPTTALYESLVTGLPVLAIYPDFIEGLISKEEAGNFGQTLHRFASVEEAFKGIDEFLGGNADDYAHEVPMNEQEGFVRILEKKRLAQGVQRFDLNKSEKLAVKS